MATHKSAAKRARQAKRKTVVNRNRRNSVKTAEKKLRQAIEKKDKTAIEQLLKAFSSKMAKTAKTGLFHWKTASRKISRLATQASAALK